MRKRAAFELADSIRPSAFCRATQTSLLRLLTTPTICGACGCRPITNVEARDKCEELLALPQVAWLAESVGMDAEWRQCATLVSPSPKVSMDAYLGAFAITAGLNFVSLDNDFVRLKSRGLQLELLSMDSGNLQSFGLPLPV